MSPQDKTKLRQFFNEAWSADETIAAFLERAQLTPEDVFRLVGSRLFQRLRRRMFGGMATTRELDVQRAAMTAAKRLTEYMAGRDVSFDELCRKTSGDAIKLARQQEDREIETERESAPLREEPADAGVSRNLTKEERVAILERMLAAARRSEA